MTERNGDSELGQKLATPASRDNSIKTDVGVVAEAFAITIINFRQSIWCLRSTIYGIFSFESYS